MCINFVDNNKRLHFADIIEIQNQFRGQDIENARVSIENNHLWLLNILLPLTDTCDSLDWGNAFDFEGWVIFREALDKWVKIAFSDRFWSIFYNFALLIVHGLLETVWNIFDFVSGDTGWVVDICLESDFLESGSQLNQAEVSANSRNTRENFKVLYW